MHAIRQFLAQRRLCALLCAVALLVKLLVPTGYMIASAHGRTTITICTGTQPRTMTMHHGKTEHGSVEIPCAFAGLAKAALDTIDPIQLAALIVFVIATGLAATIAPSPQTPVHLRPPPRGPPAAR